MKLNFVTWCPMAYTESSGGIIALHKLAHNIALLGESSFITTSQRNPAYLGLSVNEAMAFDMNQTIVIYPEIVKGNPLNAKYIMRWLLNTPDVIAYSYGEGNRNCNFYYKFAASFEKGNVVGEFKGELRAMELHFDKFCNKGEQRTESCYIVKKGKDSGWHSKGSVCIDNYEERGGNAFLADIFNRSKVFISYDNACFLSVQAALCGCLSIVVPDGTMAAEQWHDKFPYFRYGIAYGLDDIGYAIETMPIVKENLQSIEQRTLEETKRFIQDAYSLAAHS
jgi:hypothetical protein